MKLHNQIFSTPKTCMPVLQYRFLCGSQRTLIIGPIKRLVYRCRILQLALTFSPNSFLEINHSPLVSKFVVCSDISYGRLAPLLLH
jgi:hypothetical protein